VKDAHPATSSFTAGNIHLPENLATRNFCCIFVPNFLDFYEKIPMPDPDPAA